MRQGNRMNRYVILAAAAIVNFVHGNPYIWTVFQPYVQEEYGLSVAASSQPFTIIIGIFAAGNMMGGFLQHKIGARGTIFLGSAIMCGGFFMAAMAPHSMPALLSLGYGALGGFGSGCAFSMLAAVPQEWFPRQRGMVSGITIGMVGVSGILMNPLCDYVLARHGYRAAMLMVTAIYAVLSLGGFLVREPDVPGSAETPGDVSGPGIAAASDNTPCPGGAAASDSASGPGGKQFTVREMMRTKTYLVISVIMALAVPAYVLVNPLMKSLGMARGLTGAQALAGVMAASFANIIGRFALPWLSDRAGRKKILRMIYLLSMVSVIGLTAARGLLFVILASAICLVYGGIVSLFPVVVSDHFGTKYQGINYGAVMIGYGIVSILCPYLLDIAGMELSFILAGVAGGIGLFMLKFL